MKYEMTRKGMESLYLLAWRQGAMLESRPKEDPVFSGYGGDEFVEVPDELMFEETFAAPGRLAPIEEAVRAEQYARQELERRDAHLLWLGYNGV